jgi:hypothetical protein
VTRARATRRVRPRSAPVALALAAALAALAAQSARAAEPRREDRGDLIVLHVYGSYREMGRQQAELLGPVARELYAFERADYDRVLREAGAASRLADRLAVPLVSWLARRRDPRGFAAHLAGAAGALGVAPRDLFRASTGLDASSTVFAATRTATADGRALLGRNVDWGDAGGLRRPVVVHQHPEGGDLASVSAGWPLLGIPVVGVNEAGFALSMNYFDTEPLMTLWLPDWPHRRALQTARSVEDGIRAFEAAERLGIACFMAMADAAGAIALVECRPGGGCAVFRPAGDWFAHANHARSAAMLAHDRYRSPDSFTRQADMEAAVRRHLGALAPASAAEILRDRTGHPYPNGSSVANAFVLNAAIVEAGARILWHSTTMQPDAPFGAYAAFSPVEGAALPPPLPAAPFLATRAHAREAAAVERARRALRLERGGDPQAARVLWEALAAEDPPLLDPARVALARAHALHATGDLEAALAAVAPAVAPTAPFDARAFGLAQRALLADRLGRREEAVAAWRATLAHLDAGPEWNVFGGLRALARDGLASRRDRRELPIDWWVVGVPR